MTTSSTESSSAVVTLLFTDLVGSTELLSRAGDERAQRIFRAHHGLLAEAAAAHGGEEVKWLGDGLMVVFPSPAGALRAAIAMQLASRRPVEGEHLAIRVGLNAGEALRDAADYFGTPVVVARRLCDRAEGGQILCTETVAGLLAGRAGFAFSELGKLELKGLPEPVAALEVRYEATPDEGGPVTDVATVGRDAELGRLTKRLAEATAGRGGLAMVTGEPGIGKTTMLEELAGRAGHEGALVLSGGCFESEWAPPYAPFAQALSAYVATAEPEELRADLGPGAAPLAQFVPAVRQVLSDVPEPPPVEPYEERFRLLDAVAQFLVARSRRAPVLLCLDDLQWADNGTVAMLRHVARNAAQHRILVAGAYRDMDLDRTHPLTDALGAFPRETEYENLRLKGLGAEGTALLLAAIGGHDVSEKVGAAWARETDGNPFFIKELVRHLVEEGKLYRGPDGGWTTDRPLRELGLPPGVHDVVTRRLSRLSEQTNRFLAVASVFEGPFSYDTVAAVAGFPEDDALDSLEEALSAHVLRPMGADTHTFAQNLIRHTVYGEISSPRQLRFHHRVAEVLEAAYGGHPSAAQAGEIASQYHHSRSLPGAERGVEPALVAAGYAEATGAHDEGARFLHMALELLPEGDPRRPRLLGRLGAALVWSRAFDEAVDVVAQAGEGIAASEGAEAAADYLAEAVYACEMAGSSPHGWGLARRGLEYAGDRRDLTWAQLASFDLQRQAAEDPDHPGIPLDTPELWEAARILQRAHLDPMSPGPMVGVYSSGAEAATSTNLPVLGWWAGEYAHCLPLLEAEAEAALSRGQLVRAARCWALVTDCHTALGRLDEARRALEQAQALAARVGQPIYTVFQPQHHLTVALDEGWEELAPAFEALAASTNPALAWALGALWGVSARIAACRGQGNRALHFVELLVPWLERAPGWTANFSAMACHAAEALWLLGHLDHVEVVERALREKIVAPDFRYPGVDGRLALARLCALQARHDEALLWFAEARRVLDEQGARPLRAIADYDEALMYARRGGSGDADRARPLLESARRQFEAIGMTGWIRRADELRRRLDGEGAP